MRVMLALDGSPSSDAACRLVRSLAWPEGSVIRVVGAVDEVVDDLAPLVGPGLGPSSTDQRSRDQLERVLDEAVASLEKPTLTVSRAVLVGRPGSVVVDAAALFRAELVVVGSRGLGPLKSMLLGSVSAEIVDDAPCPVLVVRRSAVGHILLGVDGSASAAGAVTFLGGTHFLAGNPVEVLSVAPYESLLAPIPLAGISDAAFESYTAKVTASRERAEATAAAAVDSLRADGVHARWSIGQGNAAHEIIEAARRCGSDLIVLGSRGHTGLTRVLLGSVARNVLLHTDASVLIVREPLRARSPEREKRARRQAIGASATSPVSSPGGS